MVKHPVGPKLLARGADGIVKMDKLAGLHDCCGVAKPFAHREVFMGCLGLCVGRRDFVPRFAHTLERGPSWSPGQGRALERPERRLLH